MIKHKWYKGERQQYGEYIYRDDTCDCGCIRRTVLNEADKQEVESYTLKENVTTQEPFCTRKKYKDTERRRLMQQLRRKGIYAKDIKPGTLAEVAKNNPTRYTGRTRPPGYEDQPYCYWYLEDGECSLDNTIVWKRLEIYVRRLVKFTAWITNKAAIEPADVLLAVKEEIAHLKPFQYGDENTDAITWLIHKINTQTGREWWKYLKTFEPQKYNKLIAQQKRTSTKEIDENRAKGKKAYSGRGEKHAEGVKKVQAKMKEELSEGYLLMCIQNNLRHQTGMSYTFDEIRKDYPHLIEQKREAILLRRAKKQKT